MKNVANMNVELTLEERNLLSVGFHNVAGLYTPQLWSQGEMNLMPKGLRSTGKKVETEFTDICSDIMTVIDDHFIPSCPAGESFCVLLQDTATTTAEAKLPPTHPIRLSLALNFSVVYYEIMNSPERAYHLAKQAFDEAISELDSLNGDSYKDSTLIMQLLRDNLTLWTSDIPEDADDVQKTDASKHGGENTD